MSEEDELPIEWNPRMKSATKPGYVCVFAWGSLSHPQLVVLFITDEEYRKFGYKSTSHMIEVMKRNSLVPEPRLHSMFRAQDAPAMADHLVKKYAGINKSRRKKSP